MKKITLNSFIGIIGVLSVYLLLLSHLLNNPFNSRILYLVILICGLISLINNLKELTNNTILKVLLLLFVIILFSSIINFQLSFNSILYSILWFLVFNIALSVSHSLKFLVWISMLFFIVFFVIIIGNYFYSFIENINGFYSVTVVYYLICFVPIILLVDNKLLKFLFLIIVAAVSILSFKRGALLVVGLIILVFFLYYLFHRTKEKFSLKKAVWIISFVGLVFFIFILINNKYGINKLLSVWQYKIDTGSESGFFADVRSELYLNVLGMVFSSDPLKLFFGHGYDSVILNSSYQLSAHNDLLEILFDYGIIAFILYFIFLILLIKRYKRIKTSIIYSYISFLVILIVTGLVSHMITYPTYVYILMIYFGILVRREKSENRNINISSCLQLRS